MYIIKGGMKPLPKDPNEASGVVMECIEMLTLLHGRCSKKVWARIDLVTGDLFDILDEMIEEKADED